LFPFIISSSLEKYGFPTVLRAWAIALFVLIAPLVRFVKRRVPVSQPRRFSWDFLLTPAFMLFQLGNIVQGLGFFLPQIYLPTIAVEMGASTLMATLTLVVLNIAGVVGNVAMGSLIDRYHVTTCIAVSSFGSAIAVLVFWGSSVNLPILYVFCILYGFFAGSFSVSYAGIMKLVGRKVARTEPGIVMGALGLGRGLGNTVSGPLSSALLSGQSMHGALAYGKWFGPVILFTGCSALIGGVSIFGRLRAGMFTRR
jgi:MFS family permease